MAALSVNIGVESLLENQVEEIARDGQEKYVPQLSMSEELAKLANKIDFLSERKMDDAHEKEEEEKAVVTFQPSLWPWDSVRTKLRNALTEICVLSDVLNVVRDKKYMVLDPVPQSAPTPKPVMSLLAKRKSLASASEIILQGAERMGKAIKEREQHCSSQGENAQDFHSELMGLRQRWRLKRTGTSITGDLTYRSAGSMFRNPGLFEVTKAIRTEECDQTTVGEYRALEVTVGSDLEGFTQLSVTIIDSGIQIENAVVTGPPVLMPNVWTSADTPPWQRKLESAQANLFCKELFKQLCQEAYNSTGSQNFVMGKEIRAEVFPGTDLCITYSSTKESSAVKNDSQKAVPRAQSLHYALHALLRQRHRTDQSAPSPGSVTSFPIPGGGKRLRLAGAQALTASEATLAFKSDTILESLLRISRHTVLQKRVATVIENVTSQITDPSVSCHCSSISTSTSSSLAVHIFSSDVPDLSRVSFHVKLRDSGLRIVTSEGARVELSTHMRDLEDFIRAQVCSHRVAVARALAVNMGWHVNQYSRHAGSGPVEERGHAAGVVVTSPDGARMVAVRDGPSSGVSVSVKRPRISNDDAMPSLVTDRKWRALGSDFSEVDWEKMPGRTFVRRIFLLLAVEMSV